MACDPFFTGPNVRLGVIGNDALYAFGVLRSSSRQVTRSTLPIDHDQQRQDSLGRVLTNPNLPMGPCHSAIPRSVDQLPSEAIACRASMEGAWKPSMKSSPSVRTNPNI